MVIQEKIKKKLYPEKITDTDFADNLVLLVNTPA